MVKVERQTIKELAATIAKTNKNDYYSLVVCDGRMGIGKSCFLTQLAEEYSKIMNVPYSYEQNVTWLRQEMVEWIEGKENGKEQKPEYSAIVADELISMFYKRNWYKDEQKDTVELLNKIRDRHLLLCGAVPNFFDLDKGFLNNVTFWVHIDRRGIAWVMQQERNMALADKWNERDLVKLVRKGRGTPYNSINFVAEIVYPDWTATDKKKYYAIRNEKRINTEGQNDKRNVQHSRAVTQRNHLIRYLVNKRILSKTKVVAETGLTRRYVDMVIRGKQ